jgi:hypothetical protein
MTTVFTGILEESMFLVLVQEAKGRARKHKKVNSFIAT